MGAEDYAVDGTKKKGLSRSTILQLIAIVLLFVCLILISVVLSKVGDDDDSETTVVTTASTSNSTIAEPTDWSYRDQGSVRGPNNWHEDFGDCAGQHQSPIDLPAIHNGILNARSKLGESLTMDGLCTKYHGEENEHTWKVKDLDQCADGTLKVTLDGEVYTLLQFHLHAPSEHTVDGKYFDAETHFVFQSGSKYAVLGVLMEATSKEDNSFLSSFWPNFDNADHQIDQGINYFDFIPGTMGSDDKFTTASYFSYDGSFTTPPCTEGVKWHVFTTPVHFSFDQYNHYLRSIATLPQTHISLSNNRPIMPLNNREVKVNVYMSYDYSDTTTAVPGPASWKDIEGSECNGMEQSHIDLPSFPDAIQNAGSHLANGLSMTGHCTMFQGSVKDNTWQVDGLHECAEGKLMFDMYGNTYTLNQFHLHAPSEHIVGGKYYDAEIHFVFVDSESNLAVVGVLLEAEDGEDNAFLANFWDHFDNMHHNVSGGIDYYSFLPGNMKESADGTMEYDSGSYQSYDGSLTTPPCSEGVKWHVFTKPVKFSQKQLSQYKKALVHLPQTYDSLTNERPIQPLNSRTVTLNLDIDYDYSDTTTFAPGPAVWKDIEGSACNGAEQSPVDLPELDMSYLNTGSELAESMILGEGALCTTYMGESKDHTWQASGLHECATGKLHFNMYGNNYTLNQFHLHSPSEHTVGGKYYDAEIHFVFVDANSNLAVIGVFLDAEDGEDNQFLSKFWSNFDNKEHDAAEGIDYFSFFPMVGHGDHMDLGSFYSYDGSLTTPPCSEGVKWHVMTKPVVISQKQLDLYKHALTGMPRTYESLSNERPIQALNDREVKVNVDLVYDYSDLHTYVPGPSEWVNMPDTVCAGVEQSPIDLPAQPDAIVNDGSNLGSALSMDGDLCTSYMGESIDHTWEASGLHECPTGKLHFEMYGNTYTLNQFHLHSPSEHTVGGMYYDAEIHFVFVDSSNNLAVLGIFLEAEFGVDNTFLANFWPNFDNQQHNISEGIDYFSFFPGEKTSEGGFDAGSYFSYDGSLTTPPCSEGVKWHVFAKPVKFSQKQLDQYMKAMATFPRTYESMHNARPTQDLNARTVTVNLENTWDYSDSTTQAPGPSTWSDTFADCNGSEQSPIDLATYDFASAAAGASLRDFLSVNGDACTSYFGEANDHTWKVDKLGDCPTGKLTLTRYDNTYTLQQFHLHSPSEHTVDGKYFSAEIHFVFLAEDGSYSVVGVFLDASTTVDEPFLAQYWDNFDNMAHDLVSPLDYFSFFPSDGHYTYDGSFTTPPCTEGVKWNVFANPVQISFRQLNKYKQALGGMSQTYESLSNERPIQAKNSRTEVAYQ